MIVTYDIENRVHRSGPMPATEAAALFNLMRGGQFVQRVTVRTNEGQIVRDWSRGNPNEN